MLIVLTVFDMAIIGYNSFGLLYSFDSDGCASSIVNFDSGLYKFEDVVAVIKIIPIAVLIFLVVLAALVLFCGKKDESK